MSKGFIILPYTPRVSSPLNPTPTPTPTPPFSFSFSPTGSPLLDPDQDAPTVNKLRRRHKRKPVSVWDRLQRTKGALAWRKTVISQGREMLEVEVEEGTGRFVYYTPPARRVSAVRSSSGGFVDGTVTQSFCARSKRKGKGDEVRGKLKIGELSPSSPKGKSEDEEDDVGRGTQYNEVPFWDVDGDIVDGEDSRDGGNDTADDDGRAIFDDFVEISPITPRVNTTQAESSDASMTSSHDKPDVDGPGSSPIAAPTNINPSDETAPPAKPEPGSSFDPSSRPIVTTPESTQTPQTPDPRW